MGWRAAGFVGAACGCLFGFCHCFCHMARGVLIDCYFFLFLSLLLPCGLSPAAVGGVLIVFLFFCSCHYCCRVGCLLPIAGVDWGKNKGKKRKKNSKKNASP
jgi:hypothetical protein